MKKYKLLGVGGKEYLSEKHRGHGLAPFPCKDIYIPSLPHSLFCCFRAKIGAVIP